MVMQLHHAGRTITCRFESQLDLNFFECNSEGTNASPTMLSITVGAYLHTMTVFCKQDLVRMSDPEEKSGNCPHNVV